MFSQKADELIFVFEGHPERLVVLCRPNLSTIYLHRNISRARTNSIGLFQFCLGCTIDAVDIARTDRIVTIILNNETRLVGFLYGSSPNLVQVNNASVILDAFKNPRALKKTSLDIPRDISNGLRLWHQSLLLQRPGESALQNVKRSFPQLGSLLARESLCRAGILPETTSHFIDDAAAERIRAAIRSIQHELTAPQPRLYTEPTHSSPSLSLIPLRSFTGCSAEIFDDINEAICKCLVELRTRDESSEEKKKLTNTLRRNLEHSRRALQALHTEAEAEGRASEYEFFASTLMTHISEVSLGMHDFTIKRGAEKVSIPLLPALSPAQNAQRYYEKAKRAKTAVNGIVSRTHHLTELIAKGDELLTRSEGLNSKSEIKEFMNEHSDDLKQFGLGPKNDSKRDLPFRVFIVDGGFEVWAGKSSANNDLLTLHYAKPRDFWFHARGGSGSHVVLKVDTAKGEPGKAAREQAASIAAFYSKMKKSGLVPVAMTQKRYVRKPKGSPPGSVVVEREKVIFAVPRLPPQEPQ